MSVYALLRSVPKFYNVPSKNRGLNIINAGHAFGQPNEGVKMAPSVILHNQYGLIYRLKSLYKDTNLKIVTHNNYNTLKNFPSHFKTLTIGGDHMVAFDSIAYQLDKNPQSKVGVLYVDSHADINTGASSLTKNRHGMVVSNLMKIDRSFPNKYPRKKLCYEDIVYVGLRSLDPFEKMLLVNKSINFYSTDRVKLEGSYNVVSEILSQHFKHYDHIHVSFDVDVIDPILFPATGTPVPDGLFMDDIIGITTALQEDDRVQSMDLVEYDPSKDTEGFLCGQICNDIIVNSLII